MLFSPNSFEMRVSFSVGVGFPEYSHVRCGLCPPRFFPAGFSLR